MPWAFMAMSVTASAKPTAARAMASTAPLGAIASGKSATPRTRPGGKGCLAAPKAGDDRTGSQTAEEATEPGSGEGGAQPGITQPEPLLDLGEPREEGGYPQAVDQEHGADRQPGPFRHYASSAVLA